MNDLQKEIEEMESMLNADDPINTFAPVTDAGEEFNDSTNAPVTDDPGTDIPSTDAPGTEVPTTDAPSEFDLLKAELEELKAQLNKPKDSTEAPSTEAPIEEHQFVDEEDDLDEISRDPSKLNKLLNDVYKKAFSDARKEVSNLNIEDIPNLVASQIEVISSMKAETDEFYDNNEDLVRHKDVVSRIFTEEASKNPNKPYKEILNSIAGKARKQLGIKPNSNEGTPPKLPKRGKQARSNKTKNKPVDKFQSEREAMEHAINS